MPTYQAVLQQTFFGLACLSFVLVVLGCARTGRVQFDRCLLAGLACWDSFWLLIHSFQGWPAFLFVNCLGALLFTIFWLSRPAALLIVLAVPLLAAVLVPQFVHPRCPGTLSTCKSNLKSIATAAEMYSLDNEGLYPPTMALLTPRYLKTIPECPTLRSYSYKYRQNKAAYTVHCLGDHQATNVPYGYPQYSSYQGLCER